MARGTHKPEHWNPGVVFGFGLTLMIGCLPGIFPGLSPWFWGAGAVLGLLLMMVSARPFYFDLRQKWRGRGAEMISFWIMSSSALVFVVSSMTYFYYRTAEQPTNHNTREASLALAQLVDLGWSIRSGPEFDQLQSQAPEIPSMARSVPLFEQLVRPFKVTISQPNSIKGLHALSSIVMCKSIEIDAGSFTDISELSGFLIWNR